MNYQIADFIIRMKNAAASKRKSAVVSYTKMNMQVANILVKYGFLQNVQEETQGRKKVLVATIAYVDRTPVFTGVKIVSKPSLRVYTKAQRATKQSKKVAGVSILSTNIGIISDQEAKEKGVGGELLFTIW